MTAFLIDENVLREIGRRGNVNVVDWHDQSKPRTFGSASSRSSKSELVGNGGVARTKLAEMKLAEIDALTAAYGPRLLSIDAPIAAEWARLVGIKDKNRLDRALVATARVHDLVLVTRNVADMRGCDVRVLDPFRRQPSIELV